MTLLDDSKNIVALLQQLIEQYPVSIHIVDERGITRAVSDQFLRTFDLDREDILHAEEQSLLNTGLFKDNNLEPLLAATFSGESNTSSLLEMEMDNASGDARLLFKISFFPVRIADKTYAGLIYNNVSESAVLQRKLLAKNAELESFVYTVSHDLKSPLSVITGAVQLLKEDTPEDAPMQKQLAMIDRSTSRISSLATSLLSLSRAARNLEEDFDAIDTALIIKSVISEIRDANPETEFEVHMDTIPTIIANSETVHQLFQNLLGNAFKYRHPERKLKIDIFSRIVRNKSIFSIRDNGIGIDPADHDQIFEVFFRSQTDDRTARIEGTGVGLAIVKKIVASLNAKIWVESKVGQGSTFNISLPVKIVK